MDAYYYREGWVDHLACILYTGNLQNENCENYSYLERIDGVVK